jgi:hypothetical protein
MDDLENMELISNPAPWEDDPFEPEWIRQNRLMQAQYSGLHDSKLHIGALDGWVSLVPCTRGSDDSEMDIDYLHREASPPRKRSFMDKMEVGELIEEPSSWNIDRLFKDSEISTDTSSETAKKRRYWTRVEEELLLNFMNCQPHSKISSEAWYALASQLDRSVCSIRTKAAQLKRFGLSRRQNCVAGEKAEIGSTVKRPKFQDMITQALQSLPGKTGTKDEIVFKIEELFGKSLPDCISSSASSKETRWKLTVKQLLSTSFHKIHGVYTLTANAPHLEVYQCHSMTDYIIWSLQDTKGLTKSQIKSKISNQFGSVLNFSVSTDSDLKTWEKTLLKKLGSCSFVDRRQARDKFILPG